MDTTAIEAKIRKEQKSTLGYILGVFDPTQGWGIIWDNYRKSELLEKVLNSRDKWPRLRQLQTYKEFFEQEPTPAPTPNLESERSEKKTLNLKPTWPEALRVYLFALENGTYKGRREAIKGLEEMAKVAQAYVELREAEEKQKGISPV